MKKFVLAIIALVYLVISSGFTLDMHYCMNKPAGWNLFNAGNKICRVCGMHKSKSPGCCKDEQKLVKFTQDQRINNNRIPVISPQPTVLLCPVIENIRLFSVLSTAKTISLPPPLRQFIPAYLRNENFRI